MLRMDFGDGTTPFCLKPTAVSIPVATPLHHPPTCEIPNPSPESALRC